MHLDRRLLRDVHPVRVWLLGAVILGLVAGVLLVAGAYTLSQTVSRVFLDGDTLADVQSLLIAFGGIVLLRALLVWGSDVAAHHVASHVKMELRERLVRHLAALGPAYTRQERSGELATTATTGIEELDAYLSEFLPQLFLSALVPLAMLVIIFPIDPLTGVVLLLTAPLIPFFMILIGTMADARARRQWTTLSRLSAHFLDSLQGLTTLKLFGRAHRQADSIALVSDRFRDTTMSVLRVAFLSALALELLSTLSTAIVAVEIGLRLLYFRISFEEAFFVLILAPEFYLPLRLLGSRFHASTSGAAAAERIYAVLETRLPDCDGQPRRSTIRRNVPSPALHTVRFEDVRYTYPSTDKNEDRPALHDVSFAILPGHKVALVGPSGSGKSTITQLLLRFLEPGSGRIVVGDVPLCDLDPDAWRAQVAWVP
ncbi:MAG: thiol reductant ABC exporter subunit CydD, partial [Chloroflexi bacterium]|nr:thiol reductant ABC exporter subunit CydD [Chloroflexota bacterium]